MALNQEFWLQQKRREASWQLILIPYCWAIEVTFRQSGLPKEAGSGTRATMGAFETAPVCTALGAAHAAAADGCPTAHRRNVPRSALRSGASAERTEMRRSLCRRRHGRMPDRMPRPGHGRSLVACPQKAFGEILHTSAACIARAALQGQYIQLSHTMTGTPMTRLCRLSLTASP